MYGILKMFSFRSFVEIKASSFFRFGDRLFSLFRYFLDTLVTQLTKWRCDNVVVSLWQRYIITL